MITAWRVTRNRHAAEGFAGTGAALFGGRWNSKGRAVVYTSAELAVALLEIIVHLPRPRYLHNHSGAMAQIPPDLAQTVESLPGDWKHNLRTTQQIGDQWLRSKLTPVLSVPSAVFGCGAVVPTNYLLNPAHDAFAELTFGEFEPLSIDPRIL